MRRLRVCMAVGFVFTLLATATISPAEAFLTEFNGVSPRWQQGGFVDYSIDPALRDRLNDAGPGSFVGDPASIVTSAADTWSQGGRLQLFNNGRYDVAFTRRITAVDFSVPDILPDRCDVDDGVWAVVCLDWVGNQITNSDTYFNRSRTIAWNDQGRMVNGAVRQADFLTVALHEFGHWMFLGDINNRDHQREAVMWFNGDVAKRILREDDKHGITMLHGPNTGWEPGEAWGFTAQEWVGGVQWNRENVLAYTRGVFGYYRSFAPPPELGRVGPELGVSPANYGGTGGGQIRMAGWADDVNNSHAYFTLFTGEQLDRPGQPNTGTGDVTPLPWQQRSYARIEQGMGLHWCQYNYEQATMSIDLELVDDAGNFSNMRDNPVPVRDLETQTPTHPAQRAGALGERAGRCFTANLSPLEGRRITRVLVAYDNGGNGRTGPFRGYFDNVFLFSGVRAATLGVVGNGTIAANPPGPNYAPHTPVTITAAPGAGQIFTGWRVNGINVGWANPLTMTVDDRVNVVAHFVPAPSFQDVPASAPYAEAVRQMAARGIIRGCDQSASPPFFCPNEPVVRAQSAAFIARAMVGWDLEDWGNPFPDRCDRYGQACIDPALWRNVGTLNHYGVAGGYTDSSTCAAEGTTAPCYLPRNNVLHVQVISFISRAMIAKGYCVRQPDNPNLYTNVPNSGTQRSDLATYVYYAGPVPGYPTNGSFTAYDQPALRQWFALAEWQAIDSYFRVDRTP